MASDFLSRRRFAQASLAALAAGCAPSQSAPDIIVHGGQIYTGDGSTTVEAVRISHGEYAFAGSFADAQSGARGATLLNLGGGAAYPGFVDSHVHLGGVGLLALQLDLTGVASIAALQTQVRAYAQAHPEGPIIGRGWIETHWPERRFPTKADLDAAVSDRPVFLTRADGHAAVANTPMLALAQITGATRDPAGGRIERDGAGAATGMLIDAAADQAESRLPTPTRAQRKQALKQAAELYASRGWTGIANMSTSMEEAALFEELAAAGELPLKADLYIGSPEADAFFARGVWEDPARLVNVRGLKLYMDGALGSRGALLLAPYADMPASSGLQVTPLEQLRDIMRRARQARAQIACHAIGDLGNRRTLDAFQQTFGDDAPGLRHARWRVEHAQIVSPNDIPRFGQLGVIASMQPSHCIGDMYFAPARLGPNRLDGAYAWRRLLDTGATICAGTDAPVEKGDPLIEFYAAAYRHALDGFAGPDWRLDQAVSRAQALTMLTRAAAYATFQEEARGAIAVGKRADLTAFSADLMQAAFADIPTANAILTISDGRVTHNAL